MNIIAGFGFVFMCILLYLMFGVCKDVIKDNDQLRREIIHIENELADIDTRIAANTARCAQLEKDAQHDRDIRREKFNDEEFSV